MLTQWPALKYSTHVFLIATRRNSPVIQQLVYRWKKNKRVYLYKGIWHNNKNMKVTTNAWKTKDVSQLCKWEKPDIESYILYDFMAMDFWKRHNCWYRNVSVVARVQEWRKESDGKYPKGAFLNIETLSTFFIVVAFTPQYTFVKNLQMVIR